MDTYSGSKKARSALAFLRSNITSGVWPINKAIPKEPELTELLGVGRSTVREAVRSLANLGMLETIRGVGTFVRSRTPISPVLTEFIADYGVDQILVYRHALEIEAARLAAMNRTDEHLVALQAALNDDQFASDQQQATIGAPSPGQFHHLIFDATNCPLLVAVYSGVMAAIRAAIKEKRIIHGASHELRHRDHEILFDAITQSDGTKAAHTMALHVDRDLIPHDPDLTVPQPATTTSSAYSS